MNLPHGIVDLLTKAQKSYKIRVIRDTDIDAAKSIFAEGMNDYSHTGANVRRPFLPISPKHKEFLDKSEDIWAVGFSRYIDYHLQQPNMGLIKDYWSLPRRSVFLVAEHIETGAVVGTVAIQPVILNSRTDPYGSAHISRVDYIDSICNGDDLYADQISLAMGSLPSEYYTDDAPLYDISSYKPLPRIITPTDEHPRTPLPIPETCTCAHVHKQCQTNIVQHITQLRIDSHMLLSQYKCDSDEYNQELHKLAHQCREQSTICPCIVDASKIIRQVELSKSSNMVLCPYCIKDAAYLLPGRPAATNSSSSSAMASSEQPDTTTNNNNDDDDDDDIDYDPLPQPRPFCTVPQGFFRRFQPQHDFSLPIPDGLTSTTWTEYAAQRIAAAEQQQHQQQPDQQQEPLPWSTPYPEYTTIAPHLEVLSPSDYKYNECELRRMSVTGHHRRGTGVAHLLIFTALQIAHQIYGYQLLHLSTSQTMDLATKFYRRIGFREAATNFDFDVRSLWPIVDYTWSLTQHGHNQASLKYYDAALLNDY